ncbi:MAG: hypothetical protein QM662_16970 [Gordonia sp. (in: high G+C Gram-positive bacteria)]
MTDDAESIDTWLVANDPAGTSAPPEEVWETALAGAFDPDHEIDDDLTEPTGPDPTDTDGGTDPIDDGIAGIDSHTDSHTDDGDADDWDTDEWDTDGGTDDWGTDDADPDTGDDDLWEDTGGL